MSNYLRKATRVSSHPTTPHIITDLSIVRPRCRHLSLPTRNSIISALLQKDFYSLRTISTTDIVIFAPILPRTPQEGTLPCEGCSPDAPESRCCNAVPRALRLSLHKPISRTCVGTVKDNAPLFDLGCSARNARNQNILKNACYWLVAQDNRRSV